MGTSTVLSAMEWQPPSRLPTTSSGDICMPAYKLHKHHHPTSKLRFVTPDKESSMSTLWQEVEFKQICSRESLTEKAANIEKTSTKGHAMISTRQCFMKIIFGIGGQMAWDEVGRDSPSTTQKP